MDVIKIGGASGIDFDAVIHDVAELAPRVGGRSWSTAGPMRRRDSANDWAIRRGS